MDRIFIQQIIKDNPDNAAITAALEQFCGRNMDFHVSVHNVLSPAQIPVFVQNFADTPKVVPIGSVDFASVFLKKIKGEDFVMKPLEIPECLGSFLCRKYYVKKGSDLSEEELSGKYFVKDISRLKSWNSSLLFGRGLRYFIHDDRIYAVSDFVEFDSEWRAFVYKDEVLGISCYQGEPAVLPSGDVLSSMVATYAYEEHPQAYTLDLGCRADGGVIITEPIEVHPFVACGLYGFYDTKLPDMWDAGYQWYLRQ